MLRAKSLNNSRRNGPHLRHLAISVSTPFTLGRCLLDWHARSAKANPWFVIPLQRAPVGAVGYRFTPAATLRAI